MLPKICLLGLIKALPVHLVPCWLFGWWLWRAGCIPQDYFLLYDKSIYIELLYIIIITCTLEHMQKLGTDKIEQQQVKIKTCLNLSKLKHHK